jgi:hypothetical protein
MISNNKLGRRGGKQRNTSLVYRRSRSLCERDASLLEETVDRELSCTIPKHVWQSSYIQAFSGRKLIFPVFFFCMYIQTCFGVFFSRISCAENKCRI